MAWINTQKLSQVTGEFKLLRQICKLYSNSKTKAVISPYCLVDLESETELFQTVGELQDMKKTRSRTHDQAISNFTVRSGLSDILPSRNVFSGDS